jgi:predicted nucleic acid binding AN1-type Zn finger protein
VKLFLLVIIALIVVLILFFVTLRIRKSSGNVIKFRKKNSKQDLQKCTYCKKRSKLTFYASDDGTVVGVCKECKPKADSRDMLPI